MDQNKQLFNLADVAEVLSKRKKFILLFVLMSTIIAAAIVFFVLPKQYKSTAIVIAANPLLADKDKIFNEHIEGLYSAYGSEDDLNRLFGIASLDTTFKLVVDKFNLVEYYKIDGNDAALNQRKAINALKDDIDLLKTELYQLKVSAITKDNILSASIANYIVEIVQQMAGEVYKKSYESTLQNLTASSAELEQQYNLIRDSSRNELSGVKKQGLLEQLRHNEKIANQYKVVLANNAPSLMVLEKAYPSAKADEPKKVLILAAAFLASLAFGVIAVLIFERR